MIHKLDASHECVLNNWVAIAQMKECCTQAETYLKEVCRKAFNTLNSRNKGEFEPDELINKESWFQFYPLGVRRWNGTQTSLITLGIEEFSVESVLHLGETRCAAYVHSPYRADKAIKDNITERLASVTPPPGFTLLFDDPSRGYIFRQEQPALSTAEFCDQAKLEGYFADPMLVLLQWYKANEAAIIKSASRVRR